MESEMFACPFVTDVAVCLLGLFEKKKNKNDLYLKMYIHMSSKSYASRRDKMTCKLEWR